MGKTLNTIQKISNVCRIFAKIIFIILIVAAVLCLVSFVGMKHGADAAVSYGEMTANGLVPELEGFDISDICAAIAGAFIVVVGEAVVVKFAELYFKHELEAGTPFTFEGAKEIKRLGILAIVIPIVAEIIASIVTSVAEQLNGSNLPQDTTISVSLGMGLMCLALAVVFRYGTELRLAAEAEKTEEEN